MLGTQLEIIEEKLQGYYFPHTFFDLKVYKH